MKIAMMAAIAAFLCFSAVTAPAARAGAAAALAASPAGAEGNALLVKIGRRAYYRRARGHVRRSTPGYRRGGTSAATPIATVPAIIAAGAG